MAAANPLQPISAPVVSQKQRKAALRKERRKRKRQALAQARECDSRNEAICPPGTEEEINDGDGEDNDVAEEERLRRHEEWLQRERLAQEEFRLRYEREEAARKRKEEEERRIKEEWEAQQKKEHEEKEQKQQEKRDREEAVQKMLDEAENQLENGGPWMNPEAPVTATGNSDNFGTERDVANCPFFLKTGACRFGDRCSRKHVYPTTSPTLMIRGMFRIFGMEQSRRDDYDVDACLEHSEEELHESFLEFYHDVLPEFKSVGKVLQFKVCCNHEPHLRGNVYIQFETDEQCKEAFIKFNGRYYAGRQLHCEISPVTRWKNAICGLFDRQKCPKGKHCNFLHVFRNPGIEFWDADRDLHMSPNRSVAGSRRDGSRSERFSDRSWRQRRYSRSPVRSERSHSRREDDRRRSRSRERRASHQYREETWSSRSRHSDSRKERHLRRSRERSRSRSRERSRSRSKERPQRRLRNGSRDQDRAPRHRDRSKERDSRDRDTQREVREKSRSTSRERERNKPEREKSPEKPDKNKKRSDDDTDAHHRHRHSKKSKKKSKKKKKKKRKSRSSEGTPSPVESEKEKESEEEEEEEEETVDSAPSPSSEMNETEVTQKNCDLDESADAENNSSSEVKSEQMSQAS
ncbi:U2 small nuclear ribonucleoprotein auxiliary factor 35 kDa subunit-related protein 2 [Mugil cephalus]|uniref:U2 small nuclear ribonucleoprotein auxiliary factor 35 kDa subunit-related protein 2 n=1 Tax=Mugil cephalus TaxID=48193 RepID=UPI001FB622F9|nr:U2 small nuclear ribonucleoprotein auxiliary factor 35 kDa subunit-related protein 2 [Mugil cephalus]